MTRIRIDPQKVEVIARQLIARGDRLAEIGHELQRAIDGLNTAAWDGQSRHQAEPLLDRVRPESAHVAAMLDVLGRKLLHVAETFEREDTTAARNLVGMPWVDFETAGGQVLGVASVAGTASTVMFASMDAPSSEYRIRDIAKMSWADRFDYADELADNIRILNKERQNLEGLIDKETDEIISIERQLQHLKAKRATLQEKADHWFNKLRPADDGLQKGWDDGILDAPWRTESDDLEDQIGDLDREIEDLERQKQDLVQQRDSHRQKLVDVNENLGRLQASQKSLKRVMRAEGCSQQSCSPTIGANVNQSQGVHFSGESHGQPRGVAIDIAPQDKSKVPSVHSMRDGTVVGVGYDADGYGNYAKILQDDGKVVLYAHLSEKPAFKVDQTVRTGEQIGTMGNTGESTGPHLHLEFREPNSPDPEKYVTDTYGMVNNYNDGTFTPEKYLEENGVSI